ncbi:hypothetical protein E2C01_006068 [Portunus trituberculatus]|uniref:Uncharacterized protein n=1 Tax=Portunus trituberculatus TaxID=210409 RepID=A0A5B7CYA0_PORTR|nr:hypothetical protein [Portunus trituberculatus]
MNDVTKWRESMPGSTDRQERPKVMLWSADCAEVRTQKFAFPHMSQTSASRLVVSRYGEAEVRNEVRKYPALKI